MLRAPGLLQLFQLLLLLRLHPWPVRGQTGSGCGHSVLTPYSGTLTSKNYPGTYPNFTSCEWKIHVPLGSYLSLSFGDMDIEASEQCKSGFLLLFSPSDGSSYGPYCSNSILPHTVLVLDSNSVTVLFNSTTHRSGRGFLLSYARGNQSDLISCLQKGIHYYTEQIRVFCPAGCKGVKGDIWGNPNQGYRDTSVICKAAVHAGVIVDEQGGHVTMSQKKGITLYESTFANGLTSKRGGLITICVWLDPDTYPSFSPFVLNRGPLSEKRLIFHKACDGALEIASFNASSYWREQTVTGEIKAWTAEQAAFSADDTSWVADQSSAGEWLEIDLGRRKNITGIITKGSSHQHNYYVKSYRILSSKDGKNWKVYKSSYGNEDKIFEGNSNSHEEASHTFIPPILAQYLRIVPLSWNKKVALKVALLGCQAAQQKAVRPYSDSGIHNAPKELLTSSPAIFTPVPGIVINPEKTGPPFLVMLLIGGAVLIASFLLLLVFLCRKKRKTTVEQECSLMKGYPTSEASQVCSRRSLQLSTSEMGSFPGSGMTADLSETQSPEYAEPDVVQVSPSSQTASSTFKPAPDEGYTLPLVVNHYDVPGKYHEYAEPLPPEPEYATPFIDQPAEPEGGAAQKNICVVKVIPSSQNQAGQLASRGCPEPQMQYDFPTQRPAGKQDSAAGEAGLLEGSVEDGTLYMEPQGDRTLSPRDGHPSSQLATTPQDLSFQIQDSPLAHVYHKPL